MPKKKKARTQKRTIQSGWPFRFLEVGNIEHMLEKTHLAGHVWPHTHYLTMVRPVENQAATSKSLRAAVPLMATWGWLEKQVSPHRVLRSNELKSMFTVWTSVSSFLKTVWRGSFKALKSGVWLLWHRGVLTQGAKAGRCLLGFTSTNSTHWTRHLHCVCDVGAFGCRNNMSGLHGAA